MIFIIIYFSLNTILTLLVFNDIVKISKGDNVVAFLIFFIFELMASLICLLMAIRSILKSRK